MRMFLYTDGGPFCLATKANHNTRHDVFIVHATCREVGEILLAPNAADILISRADTIMKTTYLQQNFFVCTDGIKLYDSRNKSFLTVDSEQWPELIPLKWDAVNTWFAEAMHHQFPLVAHRYLLTKDRYDALYALAIEIPETDPDKSVIGRPLVFPKAFSQEIPLISDKYIIEDGTAFQVVCDNGRWQMASMLPAYMTSVARIFFQRYQQPLATTAA